MRVVESTSLHWLHYSSIIYHLESLKLLASWHGDVQERIAITKGFAKEHLNNVNVLVKNLICTKSNYFLLRKGLLEGFGSRFFFQEKDSYRFKFIVLLIGHPARQVNDNIYVFLYTLLYTFPNKQENIIQMHVSGTEELHWRHTIIYSIIVCVRTRNSIHCFILNKLLTVFVFVL
ncbi:hypothetical protein ACJX0J_018810, partial [Zea mays]